MVGLIPEAGLYVGFKQCFSIASEIGSLLESGIISFDDYPHLVNFRNYIDNAFKNLF